MSQFETREYQDRAAAWLSVRKRGIVQAPAGSGKSRLLAMALNAVITKVPRTKPVKIGWIAPTIETRNQGIEAMNQFPIVAAQDIRIACAAACEDWSDRDVLIVDEMHHSGSPTNKKQIESCQNARWGVSATPWMEYDMDRNKVVAEMFGNACFTISRGEVAGKIVSAKVWMLTDTDEGLSDIDEEHPGPISVAIAKEIKRLSKVPKEFRNVEDWQIEMTVSARLAHTMGIIENTKRNEAVVNCAIKHAEDSTIVLVGQIEHGEFLASKIPGSKVCFSGMGVKARRETLAAFKSGDLKCVVATSMLDEGADFPRAGVLVMAVGGASKRLAEQRTGRVLRSFQGKSHGVIYDFVDSFHPVLENQSKKRVKLYSKLGYQVFMPGENSTLL